jgi:hypothetical protein
MPPPAPSKQSQRALARTRSGSFAASEAPVSMDEDLVGSGAAAELLHQKTKPSEFATKGHRRVSGCLEGPLKTRRRQPGQADLRLIGVNVESSRETPCDKQPVEEAAKNAPLLAGLSDDTQASTRLHRSALESLFYRASARKMGAPSRSHPASRPKPGAHRRTRRPQRRGREWASPGPLLPARAFLC